MDRIFINALATEAVIGIYDWEREVRQKLEIDLEMWMDLAAAGISTVLWTTGYAPDYGWLDLPILDEFETPRHVRGVTEVPGLTMLGMLFQHDNASANLVGIARDAAYLAARL